MPACVLSSDSSDLAPDNNTISYNTNNDDTVKPTIVNDTVVLQALDKVTARVKTIEAKVGRVITFGTLNITAQRCLKTPPEDPPEAVVFLDIQENNSSNIPYSLFRGWMFASNPSLSALEHPVYDIWIKDCKNPIDSEFDHGNITQQSIVNSIVTNKNLDSQNLLTNDNKPTINIDDIEDNPPIMSVDPLEQAPD